MPPHPITSDPGTILVTRLRQTNRDRSLLQSGDRVLVAVSGGPDSLALLHALCFLRDELRIELVAAHLNHRMRGPAGDADARFVQETAASWGIPAVIDARYIPRLARRAGLSLEEAGRAARYRFFARAARHTGCTVVATGHTADDRAETVLLHLFRGTGLDGLAGFPTRRPLSSKLSSIEVVRPLIDVTRAEVNEYCATHDLQPRHDATNESREFIRNRLRHELLPVIEAEYAPEIRRHLLRLARLAEQEAAFLNVLAAELLSRAIGAGLEGTTTETQRHGGSVGNSGWVAVGASRSREHEPRTPSLQSPTSSDTGSQPAVAHLPLHLSRQEILEASPVLARRALRLAIQLVQPGAPPELAVVERLLSLARGERPGFTLPGGAVAARVTETGVSLETVIIETVPTQDEPVELAVPGTTFLPWAGGALQAEVLSAGSWVFGPDERPRLTSTPNTEHRTPTPNQALLDRDRLVGPLTARSPRPGDRIQPLGMRGHRTLHDLFGDRKLPRAARSRVPVVSDAEKIVWVAGCCVSEAAKITPETKEVILLVWAAATL